MNEGQGSCQEAVEMGWGVVAIERKEQMCENRIVRCDMSTCSPGAPGGRGHSVPGSGSWRR